MNILYFANPNTIHDLKWISFFAEQPDNHCYLVPQRHQERQLLEYSSAECLKNQWGFELLPAVMDFSISTSYQLIQCFYYVKRLIAKYHIDILHLIYADPNALWALGRKYFNRPIVLTTRGTDILVTIPAFFERTDLISKLIRLGYKKAFKNIDVITSTSARQKESIQYLFTEYPDIHLIRTGVSVNLINSDTSKNLPSSLKGKKFIFFPRKMTPLYNHEMSIDAISKLDLGLLNNFIFVFLDKNSKNKKYVHKIQKLMLSVSEAKFEFFEDLSQLSMFELYKRASLVVMTPVSDGSPVSAMEAMFCKTPLILPALPYDQDLFGGGVHLLQTWDSTELATAMQAILSGQIRLDTDEAMVNLLNKGDRLKEMNRLNDVYKQLMG